MLHTRRCAWRAGCPRDTDEGGIEGGVDIEWLEETAHELEDV